MYPDSSKQLGKYQLIDVVGKGAMGVVHRAFDPVLNRTLAIKVMSAVIASDGQLRERFLREARAAGSLQHPNVITIFDFGEMEEHLFIAMEFVEGYDLAEMIKKRVPLAAEAKLDILIDTLNGLGYAHSHGVVHRDIKPANIRVTIEGRAKLMDFGIAHLQQSELTRSGEMVGTPQYMAPEQVSGDPITPATDIFSLGCVAYELFTYARPFDGETLHAVLFSIMSAEPRAVTQIASSLPPALDAIISKAMAKDPRERYESAAAMAKALLGVRHALSPTLDTASLVLRDAARVTLVPDTIPRASAAGSLRQPVTAAPTPTVAPASGTPVWARLAAFGIGAAALVAIVWLAPWRSSGGTETPGSPVATAPTTPLPEPATPVAASPVSPQPRSAAVGTPPARSAAATPARDTLVTSIRTSAVLARRRASEAGATSAELSDGDLELQAADAAFTQTRSADAISRLAAATQRWGVAERAARERRTAEERLRTEFASAALPALPSAVTTPAASPGTGGAPAPASSTSAPAAVTPERPNPAESRAAVERQVATYELAIESGDLAQIRRVYPGLTATQQSSFEEFFRVARNLRATLRLISLDLVDDQATAQVDVLYEYANRSTGRDDRNQFRQVMTFNRDANSSWRLTAVH